MSRPKVKDAPYSAPVELPPEDPINRIDLNDGVKYYTHSQAAVMLDMHRVTLLRMEQRGVIPKAKWAAMPVPHRVYTREDITHLNKLIRAMEVQKNKGREFVE